MIRKNIEVFNVGTLEEAPDGGVTWLRFPADVDAALSDNGKSQNRGCTGVELRFVLHSESVTIRLARRTPGGHARHVFHVFHGSIQGRWDDHESDKALECDEYDFVIPRPKNYEYLHRAADACGDPFDPEVMRVIFDGGHFRLVDVRGDVEPPRPEQCPGKTILFYGSSITHGSNSIDTSHSFAQQVGHALRADVRNLGLAGACRLEAATADYLAAEGEGGRWNAAVCELGINVLPWDEAKIRERVTYFLRAVAGRNPDKPVWVVSPFFCNNDFAGKTDAARWRRVIEAVTAELALPNVTYINGLDLCGDVSLMSADEVHPNIWGVQKIADGLIARMSGTAF